VAELLKRLRHHGDQPVRLNFGGARLRFQFDTVSLTVSSVDASYPEWASILERAKAGAQVIQAAAPAFLAAFERVSLVARDEPGLELCYRSGEATLRTERADRAPRKHSPCSASKQGESCSIARSFAWRPPPSAVRTSHCA
jgi:DNA polymerase III sliding clamp (beta) subunit (PCNA family)